MSIELVELSQRLARADQRLARLEVREGLVPPQAIDLIELAGQAQAGGGALTVSLIKTHLAKLETASDTTGGRAA